MSPLATRCCAGSPRSCRVASNELPILSPVRVRRPRGSGILMLLWMSERVATDRQHRLDRRPRQAAEVFAFSQVVESAPGRE